MKVGSDAGGSRDVLDVETEVQGVLSEAIAAARPSDPGGLAFARARVAAGLFQPGCSSGVGRFQLLDRLAAGGMGVIYAAYDPELERPVAVKLVHVRGADAASALAEAKALARLSHPNVVTIFDYGVVEEHLYIVMELVPGQTLRRWVRGRSRREVLRAYRQAGEGLASAHAAALVHRDFKPDNALMGRDGRVRVVDFGLACEATDLAYGTPPVQQRGGTPGYMAPEQVAGGPITAATDQYGFCMALEEGLRQQGGPSASSALPRWLQVVIDRGRAADPAQRFPSMGDLLHALSRDPAVRRRRWIAAGALLAAGATAFIAGRSTWRAREAFCEGGPALLAAVWGEEGRATTLNRIAKMSPYGATLAPRIETALNDHARRWEKEYQSVCLASGRGADSAGVGERRMACLDQGKAALKSLAEVVHTSDLHSLPSLALAVRALPDPAACGDLAALLSGAEPPPADVAPQVAGLRSRLAEARMQVAAGRGTQMVGAMAGTVAAARSTAYMPLLSEALLVQGRAIMGTAERDAAVPPLTEAYVTAFESGLWSLAVESWARRAWAHGTTIGGPEALAGLDVVEAIAANKATSPFSRALLFNNVGCVQLALQKRDRARVAFERASREASGATGPDAAELLNVKGNLGLVIDDPIRRDEVLSAAITDEAKGLGENHPDTLNAIWSRGKMTVAFVRAVEFMVPACEGFGIHGDYRGVACWMDAAFIRAEMGDQKGAVTALEAAVSTGESSETLGSIVPYLHLWGGDGSRAAREFATVEASLPAEEDQAWWRRLDRADLQLGLGRALRAAGKLKEAKRALASSLATFLEIAEKDPSPTSSRRLGRARAELAKTQFALDGAGPTVTEFARAAADWLRQAGGVDAEIAELQRMAENAGRPARYQGHSAVPQ